MLYIALRVCQRPMCVLQSACSESGCVVCGPSVNVVTEADNKCVALGLCRHWPAPGVTQSVVTSEQCWCPLLIDTSGAH